MFGISLSGLILRFIIGGAAVAGASIIASKVGGKIGGIFATLPAVFLAAILALSVDHHGEELVHASMNLSSGAIIGITSCILTVIFASYFVPKTGFKKGAVLSTLCWFIISCIFFALKNI